MILLSAINNGVSGAGAIVLSPIEHQSIFSQSEPLKRNSVFRIYDDTIKPPGYRQLTVSKASVRKDETIAYLVRPVQEKRAS